MKKLVAFFIRYPVAVNTLMASIAIFGILGYNSLTSTFFPVIPSRIILVEATYPGASPAEMEEGIVQKIEENLKGVTGIERITSLSAENRATITVEAFRGEDPSEVLEDVKNAVESIPSFPTGMEPLRTFLRENLTFTISFALSGPNLDLHTLKAEARKIEEDLLDIPGISKVELGGFPEEEIEIAFLEDKLRTYGVTFQEAALAVRNANLDLTGGTIEGAEEELLIRARNKGYHARDLEQIVIKGAPGGQTVRLRDLATVRDQFADEPSRMFLNGEPAVTVTVSNTDDEDLLGTADLVKAYLSRYNATQRDLHATVIQDFSKTLRDRKELLIENGIIGVLLVLILLSLFLNIRLAFWVALGIPFSFLGMFILANFFGVTINVISLFGMIVVVGILVDDGIVISENIYQHYERGKSAIRAAVDGTFEVMPAVISAVLTTCIAFSAFFFLDGRAGEFFPDMAFIVIATLAVSLIEAAIILPSHIAHSKALHGEKKNRLEDAMDRLLSGMREKLYAPVLRFMLNNRFFGLALPVGLLLLTVGGFRGGVIKATFFPFIERDNIEITLNMPAGTPEEVTLEYLNRIELAAIEVNEHLKEGREDSLDVIVEIDKRVGPQPFSGRLNLILQDAELRGIQSFVVANMVRQQTGPIKEAENLSFGQASAFGKPVSVSLLSNDFAQLEAAKEELKAYMEELASLTDVLDNDQQGLREVELTLKDKAYLLGLDLQTVVGQVRQGFFGLEVQRLQRGRDEVKVWVRYAREDRSSLEKLQNMRIRTPGGSYPLSELAELSISRGVIGINHLDGKREIKVEADLADPSESAPDIIANIRDEFMPQLQARYPNVGALYEGQNREAMKTARSSQKVMPFIFITMILVITFTFRSLSQTLAIFLLIPLSLTGVAWGHWMHGLSMSIFSYLGIIALIGIIVNDSLVLVSKMNSLLKEDVPLKEAVYRAGLSRFRAIFLTTVTTVAGLAPLIFEKSFQAQFLIPMAISVAYGIGYATLLTLITLPVMLSYLNSIYRVIHWLRTGHWPEPEAVEPAIIEKEFERESI